MNILITVTPLFERMLRGEEALAQDAIGGDTSQRKAQLCSLLDITTEPEPTDSLDVIGTVSGGETLPKCLPIA